ncbi:MAG: leucine-rich repeat protein [Clostridia bacterium]|nr:leucine-rich repeat protein [Clostridia bacterium]
MKKKILLISLMVVIFTMALVFSVSAENKVIKLDTLPTLEEIHANPNAYVSHLDAFDSNSFYASDPNSVVVLSDQQETPTYYVFPACYVITSASYTLSFDSLNTALAEADASAFASYKRNSGRGGTIYMIRIEVPTYVNKFGYDKFEDNTNVKEVYFPTKTVVDAETGLEKEVTYFSAFSQADFFNGASSLEIIHNIDKVPTTSYTGAMFANCASLKEITLLPGLTSISSSCFSGCSSLTKIDIPSTVTSVSTKAFYGCSGLTELILPNGVTSVGKLAFSGCTKLEKLNFGESFTTFVRVNTDYETTTSCTSLKYVYIPEGFLTAISGASAGDYKHIFNISSAKIAFFFTGTEEQAEQIKTIMASTNNNPNLGNATLEKYDPTVDYTDYASTKGSNVLIWGYNKCEAFYEGTHLEDGEVAYTYVDENGNATTESYTSALKVSCPCGRSCGVESVIETIPALFTNLGYSEKEYSNGGIQISFAVNNQAVARYNEVMNTTIAYGIFAVAQGNAQDEEGNDKAIINADGTSVTGVASVDFSKHTYDIFAIRVIGFETEAHMNAQLALGAYVIDGGKVTYLQAGTPADGNTYCYTSYNEQAQ